MKSVQPSVKKGQSARAPAGQIVDAPVSPSNYLKVSAVADFLNISQMTVYRLVHSGELPAVRFGKSVRITEADMEQYCQSAAVVIHPES